MDIARYTNISTKEALTALASRPDGLTRQEAAERLRRFGPNEFRVKTATVVGIMARQVSSPFFYLLLAAGVTSFFIGGKVDSLVIMAFIAVNVALGFLQEFKAERTVALLKRIISPTARVLREGNREVIAQSQLVPGDIVILAAGDIVPAELRLVHVQGLLVDESALTGESVPTMKTQDALLQKTQEVSRVANIAFAGTFVVSGKGSGVVAAIGSQTLFSGIIASGAASRPRGVYEKNLQYFCRLILKIVIATMVIIFAANLILRGSENMFDFLLFCVALVVSILPEALPAVVIFALSQGSLRMAKENVVVKRLSAIEDLGNIEVLCTDKTGTLTQNRLSLEKVVAADSRKVMVYGLLGSQPDETAKQAMNPFDLAIAARADRGILADLKKYTIVHELGFDSFRMCSSVLAYHGVSRQRAILVTKGAPEMVLKRCVKFGRGATRKSIMAEVAREGQDGKRVILVAYKEISMRGISHHDERGLTYAGYFVFEDPLKTTAQEAIRLAKKMGIAIKIITGDSKEVAGFVARKTDLIARPDDVMLGEQLEAMSGQEFRNACEDAVVFARVSPAVKHKIIAALQYSYEVGFLGEGINDVPALKIANVAIAVAEATDVAKEAADIVLLKKDLRVIVNGIKDGRTIFANINKYIKCALASNFGNFYSIAVISLFVNFLPILPIQILLGNLLSDFPLIAIATDAVDTPELRAPRLYQLHMVLPLIIALALVSTVFDFIFFTMFSHRLPAQIQTLWFIESILTEIVLIFIVRTRRQFWKAKKPGFWLIAGTGVDVVIILALPFLAIGQQWFHFVRPPWLPLLGVLALVLLYFAASEVVKLVYFHYFKIANKSNILHRG